MRACEQCTGSRWLGDNQSLGRCVCVTPEAMRELDEEREAVRKALVVSPDYAGCLGEEVARYVEAVDGVYSSLSAGATPSGDPDKLVEYVDAALDAAYDLTPICDALSDYLVSRGDPAVPAGAVDNPALERLVSLVH